MIEYLFVIVVIVVAILAVNMVNREPMADPTAQLLRKGRNSRSKGKKQSSSDVSTPSDRGNKKSVKKKQKKKTPAAEDEPVSATPIVDQEQKKPDAAKNKKKKKKKQESKESKKEDQQPQEAVKTAEITAPASDAVPEKKESDKKKKKKKTTKEKPETTLPQKSKDAVNDGFSVVKKKRDRTKSPAVTPATPADFPAVDSVAVNSKQKKGKSRKDTSQSEQQTLAPTAMPNIDATAARTAELTAMNPNLIENPYKTYEDFWTSEPVVPQKRRDVPPQKKQATPAPKDGDIHSEESDVGESQEAQAQHSERYVQKMAEQILNRDNKQEAGAVIAPSVKVFANVGRAKVNPWASVDTEDVASETEFLGTPTDEFFPKLGEEPKKNSQRKGKGKAKSSQKQQDEESTLTERLNGDAVDDKTGASSTSIEMGGPHKRESNMVFEYDMQAPQEKRPKWDNEQVTHESTNGAIRVEEEEEEEEEVRIPVVFSCKIRYKEAQQNSLDHWTLYVVGNVEELGNDEPTKGIELEKSEEGLYTASLSCFDDDKFEYFYALVNPDDETDIKRSSGSVQFDMSEHKSSNVITLNDELSV